MRQGFNVGGFEITYKKQLRRLGSAEKITKEVLRDLSRSVLEAHHATENITYINGLIATLTPMNRKIAILFFKEFSGFRWNNELTAFEKKDKKVYNFSQELSDKALQDPHFNIWSWSERNVEVEKKPAPTLIDLIKDRAKSWHERAKKEHISDADLLVAFFEGGIDPSAVVQALDKLGYEVDVKIENPEPEQQFEEAPM